MGMLGGPIRGRWAHICVDMQLLFAPGSEWGLEWMPRVLPNIVRLCEARPASTIFTRFIPARHAGDGEGLWRDYYLKWRQFTLEEKGRQLIDLVPELAAFCPPAQTADKPVYSPWYGADFRDRLQRTGCDTLIISGGETDVCVLRRCSARSIGAIGQFSPRTQSAASRTKNTTPSSTSSGSATANRSKRPRRRNFCRNCGERLSHGRPCPTPWSHRLNQCR